MMAATAGVKRDFIDGYVGLSPLHQGCATTPEGARKHGAYLDCWSDGNNDTVNGFAGVVRVQVPNTRRPVSAAVSAREIFQAHLPTSTMSGLHGGSPQAVCEGGCLEGSGVTMDFLLG
ncbi:MAG: hypothetical protein ACLT8E_07445 [Akkermansia sp.]